MTEVSLPMAPTHPSRARSQVPVVFLCVIRSPFLGESCMILLRITTHSPLHMVLKSLSVKPRPPAPILLQPRGEHVAHSGSVSWELRFWVTAQDTRWLEWLHLNSWTPKSTSTHSCLLAPESCQDPVLPMFWSLSFSHHMIYPVSFHSNVIFFSFGQTLPVLIVVNRNINKYNLIA